MEYNCIPFFVWAGGKRRLIKQISLYYPDKLIQGQIDNYIEPFVGGGAVYLDIMQKYRIKKSTLIDLNPQVINAYIQVRDNLNALIKAISELEQEYMSYIDLSDKEKMYYDIRKKYNEYFKLDEYQAAYFLFLTKSIFNGAYRVNSKGQLNMPFGKRLNQKYYDKQNLEGISKLLQNTNLICGDYKKCERLITERTFLYFDPPYRPTEKSGQLKYTKKPFTDIEQIELSDFFKISHNIGAFAMLSNSFLGDRFLETLYQDFNYNLLDNKRLMSGDSSFRKVIKEILITNYQKGIL